jgi:hypothetical protein
MCTQSFLIHIGKTKYHRYLGWIALLAAFSFTVTSSFLYFSTIKISLGKGDVFKLVYWVDLFLIPLFVFFLVSGFVYRKSSKKHMICMLLSLVAILPPGLGRLIYGVFLYPFGAPIRYFYEPMMLITIGILIYIGHRDIWQSIQIKVALAVFSFSFATSYWFVHVDIV